MLSFLHRKKNYEVSGPNGGISTKLTMPKNFNPECDKCPVIVMMHGFMAKKDMHPVTTIAKHLAKQGIATVSFDFDAHGKSEGKFIDMTISSEIADAKAVTEYASKLPFASSISFLGHSQGGVIAGMLAGQLEDTPLRPECLIMLAPAAVLKDDAIAGQCMKSKYDASNPPEYVSVFFHKLGRKFILEAQKLPIFETSGKYTGNVCLIHGSKDAIVPPSYSVKYHDAFKNSCLIDMEGENHFFSKKKSELLNNISSFLNDCTQYGLPACDIRSAR